MDERRITLKPLKGEVRVVKRANYGVDRPDVLVTLAVAGPILLALGLMRILPPLSIYLGLVGIVFAIVFVIGGTQKRRTAERILDTLPWRGGERVLDVGCGRGLWLITAAKHLTVGRAVGIDLWNKRLQSGNSPERTLENARLEGVSDRVEVGDGDARSLPFDDESFDIVVTSLVLHHVPGREREKALNEMMRVLKHGGRAVMHELSLEVAQYSRFFHESGMTEIQVSGDAISKFLGYRTLQARKP